MRRFRTSSALVASAFLLAGLTQPPTSLTDASPTSVRRDFQDAVYGSTATSLGAVTPLGSSRDYSLSYPAASGAPYGRWNPCKPIYWRVNPRWAPPGGVTDLKGAFARVQTATGLTFVYRGTTTLIPGTAAYDKANTNGEIIVAWAPDGTSRIIPKAPRGSYGPMGVGGGSASTHVGVNGKRYTAIEDGFVLLSTSFPTLAGGFGTGNQYGWQGTRGMLDMHELGHVVGLAHARGTTQVMFPTAQRMLANWGAGDATGLRLLGKAAGCFPAFTR